MFLLTSFGWGIAAGIAIGFVIAAIIGWVMINSAYSEADKKTESQLYDEYLPGAFD